MRKTIIYGLLAAIFDATAWLNATAVAGYFTVSEWYLAAVLVIAAFLLHLAFVRSLWIALQLRAIIRAPDRAGMRQPDLQKRRAQSKGRQRAYINPWHNV